jgi:hypothetical protein
VGPGTGSLTCAYYTTENHIRANYLCMLGYCEAIQQNPITNCTNNRIGTNKIKKDRGIRKFVIFVFKKLTSGKSNILSKLEHL